MDADDCNGRSYMSGNTTVMNDGKNSLLYCCVRVTTRAVRTCVDCVLCMLWTAGSGDSSMEREFSGALGGPTVSTPNSQHTSPARSLSGEC